MGSDLSSIVIGIDEAGRGPLLGDLVIGFIALDENQLKVLGELGVRDSKELSPKQREILVKQINRFSLLSMTSYVSTYSIDRHKLNRIISNRIILLFKIFNNLYKGYINKDALIKIYIDEIKGYREYIYTNVYTLFSNSVKEFVMEKNADKKYLVVSAASILAKYTRDQNLGKAKIIFGEFGSGYPSDPKTREWISEKYKIYKDPPPIIRRSWTTLLSIAPSWYRNLKKGLSILDFINR
ncbi:MAG: ribonuclease HII [Desulfurococcales archaeon ex4484_58]|nr:MAG: ribonuclease HII [Desulfurococcales archaeon ex4484_58]